MIRKNNIWQMILLAVAVVLSGCSDDFLEKKKNYGSYDENIFNSETTMGWYIDKLYYDFFSSYNAPNKMIVGQNVDTWSKCTEEFGGTIGIFMNPNEEMSLSDIPDYYGSITDKVQNNAYTRIRTCNYLLENIDAKGGKLSENFKKYAKGQMLFLRAWQYFDLVRIYGGVPLELTVHNPESENADIKLPRSTTSACIEQICQDFQDASLLLPAQWEAANTDYGRFTRGAALAMKSRVLLFWASPLYNRNMDESRWQDALAASLAAETQLTADGFGLYGENNPGTNGSAWHEMFLKDNTVCEEAIIVMLCSNSVKNNTTRNNGWEKSIRPQSQDGGGGVKAPKEMIDMFPMADGSRPTSVNGYDDFKFFMNRDPRFYRTFTFSGRAWPYKDHEDAMLWTYRWKKGEDSYVSVNNDETNSPALVCKMSAGKNTNGDGIQYSGTDIFEYRYAELLLNIAECYAATNNVAQCTEYLKRIRKRAGLPSANNYGLGTLADKYKAIEACLYERRVELAYEGKRFWDIQRWMLYNDDQAENNTTCQMLGISPINGTCRTGNYVQVKDYVGDDDPLESEKSEIRVDPDAADFQTQLEALSSFYDNFEFVAPDTPMDNDNKEAVYIDWKQNCYVFGLPKKALESNTWLQQTKGWDDIYGTSGVFDPLK